MATPDNTNMSNMSYAFKQMIDRDKLTGENFNDWYRSLRITLRMARRYDYLGEPLPAEHAADATQAQKDAYKIEYEKHNDVACLMLAGMDTQLQKRFEPFGPMDMINELRRMFEKPPAAELYDLIESLHNCKKEAGKSVSAHFLSMKYYMDQLERLGCGYQKACALVSSCDPLIRIYIVSLYATIICIARGRLIDYEKNLNKKAPTPAVMAIQGGRITKKPNKPHNANFKGKGNGTGKGKQIANYQQKPRKQNPPF